MTRIALDAEAGQVSAELARRGIAAGTRVPVLVEVVGEQSDTLPWLPWPKLAAPSTGSPRNLTCIATPIWCSPRLWRAAKFAFGSIVLTGFPFTDLSGDKRRPALVASRDNDRRSELVVCFITSVPRAGPDMAPIAHTPGTGLKVPPVARFDKLAALDLRVIAGKLGDPLSSGSCRFLRRRSRLLHHILSRRRLDLSAL